MIFARKVLLSLAGFGLFLWSLAPGHSAAQPIKPELLSAGGMLSGELLAIRSRARKGQSVTYQLTSEPRRLSAPEGLCGLENGAETFEIVTKGDAEAAVLKPYLGKNITVKVNEVACAHEQGEFSDAIVTKWSVVK